MSIISLNKPVENKIEQVKDLLLEVANEDTDYEGVIILAMTRDGGMVTRSVGLEIAMAHFMMSLGASNIIMETTYE